MVKRWLVLIGVLCVCRMTAASDARLLEMTGEADGARPDILYLAPKLIKPPKAYTQVLAATAKSGTVLPHAPLAENVFCAMGPLPVLTAAGYRLLPVRDVSWQEATERLTEIFALRRKTRHEDGIEQAPLCVMLSEEVTPEELAQSLEALLQIEALIFLAPQDETLPLTVIWENHVWPTQRSEQSLRIEHWVATLAEIAGLPPPAECGAVSVLPLLTGSGYQRPLEQPLLLGPTAAAAQKIAPCTMISLYTQLPDNCPWVPDFTDQTKLKPTERMFVTSSLPIAAEEVPHLEARRSEQGLYVRSAVSALRVELPPHISCVVRVKGHPVFSVWKPEKETVWHFSSPDTQIIECFLVIPPKVDPLKALPFLFQSPGEAHE